MPVAITQTIVGKYFQSSTGTNHANSGIFRLSNTEQILWRNAGNTCNVGLSVNTCNVVVVNTPLRVAGTLDIAGSSLVGAANITVDDYIHFTGSTGSPATTGNIRLETGGCISWRNQADNNQHTISFDDTITFSTSITEIMVNNVPITGISSISSGAGTPACNGTLRLANGNIIGWRNVGNTYDAGILFNSCNNFAITVSGDQPVTIHKDPLPDGNVVYLQDYNFHIINSAIVPDITYSNDFPTCNLLNVNILGQDACTVQHKFAAMTVNISDNTAVNFAGSYDLFVASTGIAADSQRPIASFNGCSTGFVLTSINRGFFAVGDPTVDSLAQSGAIRLVNNNAIAWRNFTDTADYTLQVNTSNILATNAPVQASYFTAGGTKANNGAMRLAYNDRVSWRNSGNTYDAYIDFGNDTGAACTFLFIGGASEFARLNSSGFRLNTGGILCAGNITMSGTLSTPSAITSSGTIKGAVFQTSTTPTSFCGVIRLANNEKISWRNGGNSGCNILKGGTTLYYEANNATAATEFRGDWQGANRANGNVIYDVAVTAQNGSGAVKTWSDVSTVYETVTCGSEDAEMLFKVICGGTLTTFVTINAAGSTGVNFSKDLIPGCGVNVVLGTSTGTKIGTGTTQKLSFYNAAPIIQPSGTGETVGFTAGSGTAVNDDSTFTGNVGATAYRISDVVKALKNLGLIAQ